MATIKSYSDLQQSRKLAEILPIESVDMYYNDWMYDFYDGFEHTGRYKVYVGTPKTIRGELDTPCWSLAALLGLLPKRIEIADNVYELSVYLYGLYYWNIVNGNLCFESKDKDNLVDACYEAIVFLHEQKLSL